MDPRLSLVILTRNEEQDIAACLGAVAAQHDRSFETILIDAASTDATLAEARRAAAAHALPLRIIASDRLLPIGEARNLGVQSAHADLVAFVSADAELEPDWTARALQALESSDLVFGPQVHAPHRWTVGAAVRGLRYHYPEATDNPLGYASNVAAAYRKEVLLAFPFDDEANAAEDLLLAHRAVQAGFRAAYVPGMVVRHHDVKDWREELRKNVREGRGCAQYSEELGLMRGWLAWGGMLAAAGAVAATRRRGWILLAGALWLPTLRRVRRRGARVPLAPLAAATAASPAFDLAFLGNYLAALTRRARPSRQAARPLHEAADAGDTDDSPLPPAPPARTPRTLRK